MSTSVQKDEARRRFAGLHFTRREPMNEGVAGKESLSAARLAAARKVNLSLVEVDRYEVIDIAARAGKATTSQACSAKNDT